MIAIHSGWLVFSGSERVSTDELLLALHHGKGHKGVRACVSCIFNFFHDFFHLWCRLKRIQMTSPTVWCGIHSSRGRKKSCPRMGICTNPRICSAVRFVRHASFSLNIKGKKTALISQRRHGTLCDSSEEQGRAAIFTWSPGVSSAQKVNQEESGI